MKKYYLLFICLVTFLASCNQKQMKISRAGVSIQTEMKDFSPAYIEKTAQGEAKLNDNNLIGNTHWVISAERDLKLQQIAPFLQKLTDKKFNKEGMHPDDKDIYFVYSDTVNKQNAFVKLPFKSVEIDAPTPLPKDKNTVFNIMVMSLPNFIESTDIYLERKRENQLMHVSVNKKMSIEEFLSILIEIQNKNLDTTIEERISIL